MRLVNVVLPMEWQPIAGVLGDSLDLGKATRVSRRAQSLGTKTMDALAHSSPGAQKALRRNVKEMADLS